MKRVLWFKEIVYLRGISSIQRNISLLVNVSELTQPNHVFETKYLVYLNFVFALKEILFDSISPIFWIQQDAFESNNLSMDELKYFFDLKKYVSVTIQLNPFIWIKEIFFDSNILSSQCWLKCILRISTL